MGERGDVVVCSRRRVWVLNEFRNESEMKAKEEDDCRVKLVITPS